MSISVSLVSHAAGVHVGLGVIERVSSQCIIISILTRARLRIGLGFRVSS